MPNRKFWHEFPYFSSFWLINGEKSGDYEDLLDVWCFQHRGRQIASRTYESILLPFSSLLSFSLILSLPLSFLNSHPQQNCDQSKGKESCGPSSSLSFFFSNQAIMSGLCSVLAKSALVLADLVQLSTRMGSSWDVTIWLRINATIPVLFSC